MDKKINFDDFDVKIVLPDDFQEKIDAYKAEVASFDWFNQWGALIKKEKLKELRKSRIEKINEINAKNQVK